MLLEPPPVSLSLTRNAIQQLQLLYVVVAAADVAAVCYAGQFVTSECILHIISHKANYISCSSELSRLFASQEQLQ